MPSLNPICHLLALLRAHHILHVSRMRVKAHTSVLGLCAFVTKQHCLQLTVCPVCFYCWTLALALHSTNSCTNHTYTISGCNVYPRAVGPDAVCLPEMQWKWGSCLTLRYITYRK